MTTDKAIGFIRNNYKLIERASTRQEAFNHVCYLDGLIAMGSLYGPLDHNIEKELRKEVEHNYQNRLTELQNATKIGATEQAVQ